jgi:hypothetical protein
MYWLTAERALKKGYIATAAIAIPAMLLLAMASAVGQGARRDAADPEANAGAMLVAAMSASRAPVTSAAAAQEVFIDQYCSSCHNSVDWAGGLDLGNHSTRSMGQDAEIWEKVARKVRGGMMPPADATKPATVQAQQFAASIEQALDQYDKSHYRLTPSTLGRLNRTEYANAIRDILGIRIDAATLLPPDDPEAGFDNMAEMLVVSPALVEGYVAAAMQVSREAVGDLAMEAVQVAMRPTFSKDGLPLGTRGGMIAEYYFPLDADYEITIASPAGGGRRGAGAGFGAGRSGAAPAQATGATARLVVIVDGQPLQVENPARFVLTLPAGVHTIGAALVDLGRPGNVEGIFSSRSLVAGVSSIQVSGPTNVTGRGSTPGRTRLFVCKPEVIADEESCARKILAQLATRAYRRPVGAADAAILAPLMSAYQEGRRRGDFGVGIQHGVARVLVDPRFLFRVETDPALAVAGRAYPVSGLELASRLSFFLWSSVPDDELLQVAAAGRLGRPAELAKQVGRMLADPRAEALVTNFAAQWLMLRGLETAQPDDPAFDNNLRRAMNEETQLLFGSLLRENRPITTLLDAPYTFLNDRLARHYEIDGVRGAHMRRVELPADSLRRGLLGQASILTVTSVADRTSPVTRGKWVLENIMGLPVPDPPPGVETNLDASVHLQGPATLRARLESHRDNPACRNCHAVIDPIGFAMEPFDKIGKLRAEDGGLPIDARGTMVDGVALDGPDDLRDALLRNSNNFVVAFTEKLLTYALGRPVTHADAPTVRAIVRSSSADQYRLPALIMNVVESVPFRQRVATGQLASAGRDSAATAANHAPRDFLP